MEYAPVKNLLRSWIGGKPCLRKLFYFALERLFLRERYVKRALKAIVPKMAGNPRVLDAGFGYGQYSYHIAKTFGEVKVIGVEIEPEMLDDFKQFIEKTRTNNIELRELDLTKMDIEDDYDLALSVDVMEHIEDDEAVFRNVRRALKNGGVFLIHTPHIPEGLERGEGVFVGEHVRDGYTAAEIERKLLGAGFSRVEHSFSYGYWGAAAWRLLQKYPMEILSFTKLAFPLVFIYLILVYPFAEYMMRRDLKVSNLSGNGILVEAWK